MSEDMAFSNEEIGELIEFLRKEGLDPCDDAADLIEQQQSELSRLRERARELELFIGTKAKCPKIKCSSGTIWAGKPLPCNWCEEKQALLSTGRDEE